MNRSIYRFTLDLQKHRSQMSIAVFQYDSAVRLCISLTDGGNPYLIKEGGRAIFYGMRPNDTPIIHNCMIDDTGVIIYDFNDQTAAVEGITHCHIRIYGTDGELITAPKFIIVAEERLVSDADIEKLEDSPLAALDALQFADMNEEARVEAESARAVAETARAEAELARVEAEKARETTIEDLAERVHDIEDFGYVTEDEVADMIANSGGGGGAKLYKHYIVIDMSWLENEGEDDEYCHTVHYDGIVRYSYSKEKITDIYDIIPEGECLNAVGKADWYMEYIPIGALYNYGDGEFVAPMLTSTYGDEIYVDSNWEIDIYDTVSEVV